jgi:hypothetical protein
MIPKQIKNLNKQNNYTDIWQNRIWDKNWKKRQRSSPYNNQGFNSTKKISWLQIYMHLMLNTQLNKINRLALKGKNRFQ